MIKRSLAAVALTAAAIAALAGCTAAVDAEHDGEKPTPTPTSTAPQAVTQKCVDGFLLIDADKLDSTKTTSITGACDVVSVVGTGAHVALTSASRVVVEGNSNSISIDTVGAVAFAGNDNTVTHGGPAPKVDDQGSDNAVAAAK